MTQALKVGYIGLGLMGKSIARNILKAGFPLTVHNRSRAAVDELVAEEKLVRVSHAGQVFYVRKLPLKVLQED